MQRSLQSLASVARLFVMINARSIHLQINVAHAVDVLHRNFQVSYSFVCFVARSKRVKAFMFIVRCTFNVLRYEMLQLMFYVIMF